MASLERGNSSEDYDIDEDRSDALLIQPPQPHAKKKKSKHKHKSKHKRDHSEKSRRTVKVDSGEPDKGYGSRANIWDRVGPGDWEQPRSAISSRVEQPREERRSSRERFREFDRRGRDERGGRRQDDWGRRRGERGRYPESYDDRGRHGEVNEERGRHGEPHDERGRHGEPHDERGRHDRYQDRAHKGRGWREGRDERAAHDRRKRSRSPLERRRRDDERPTSGRSRDRDGHAHGEAAEKAEEYHHDEGELEEGEQRHSHSQEERASVERRSESDASGEERMEQEESREGEQSPADGRDSREGSADVEENASSPREDGEHEKSSSSSSDSEDANRSGSDEEGPVDPYRSKFDDPRSEEEDMEEDRSPEEDRSDTYDENYVVDSPERSPTPEKEDLPPYLPAIQGCRSVEEFQCLNRVEEGTYGVVYRAKDKKKDEIVALKRLKMEKEKEGFPITSLREINTLLKAQHENIVTVREIVVGSNMDKIYIVMDFVEHDLKSLMTSMKQNFLVGEVKCLMIQLLRGVGHLHDNWIVHRDLKTSNLLLSHRGILKIADFGLAREYGSPLKPYTPIVVTLWYRSAELLLGVKQYSTAVDLWSVGCIFAELFLRTALWQGKSETEQINKIFRDLGSPSERIWPGVKELPVMKKCTFADHPYNNLMKRFGSYISELCFDLMNKMFTYDPKKRITAEESLKHAYFKEEPRPIDPSMFPTWPARSEQGSVKREKTPKPPSGGKAYDSMLGDDDEKIGGFQFTSANKGAAKGYGFSLKFF